MNNQPLMSIIIPVYNVERYLRECLDSVLAQTYCGWEAIIVNDSTPDNSMLIAQEFVNKDHRFKIISQENRGLAGARNTGIREACGEYIAFLDSDDKWLPDKLQLHVNHLNSNPQLGLSYSRSEFIDENGNSLNSYQMPALDNITPGLLLTRNCVGNGSAPVLRMAALDDIAFYDVDRDYICYFDEDLRQTEDIECWFRLASTTDWQLEGIPEPLTLYRVNNSGLSANLDKQFQTWQLFLYKAVSYSPATVLEFGNLAKAYQYRYLCRRAVRSQDGSQAWAFLRKAVLTNPLIFIYEPWRSFLTLFATLVLLVLPKSLYSFIESQMMKFNGSLQRSIISRSQN